LGKWRGSRERSVVNGNVEVEVEVVVVLSVGSKPRATPNDEAGAGAGQALPRRSFRVVAQTPRACRRADAAMLSHHTHHHALHLHALRRAIATPSQRHAASHARYNSSSASSASPTLKPLIRPPPKVIFSGIQPTGIPHLGNYLGALRQWVRLQDEAEAEPDTRLLFSIVDLHAITVQQDAGELARWRKEMLASLYAIGLKKERSIVFYQSAVPQHAELMWLLSCTASMGYLSRMTQWKVRFFSSLLFSSHCSCSQLCSPY